ncbi:probable ATP-dependent RNA helicase DDX56 isoform X2 [Nematostella vectensis]|uniref:probable ATP-dependent RNA helicase DDX56 isoform X2 n=1 Tax=Nematostella vectensis TaxID=45351 RepID=UPI0020773F8B|nr:probable ATP-dependent RNA helicase DDX56 isoform X2 [Nematostella vectensis]
MADEDEQSLSFDSMGLDDRIVKAISKLNWSKPTPIQEKAITLALEGKDVLARAKTGSGKTAAYAIPVVQRILQEKQTCKESYIRALILVPTKELAQQAARNAKELSSCCAREVRVADVTQGNLPSTKPLLMDKPDIVVGTPSGILGHIQAKNMDLKDSLQMLVIDEADLVFSYGYEDDLKVLLSHLPKIYQAFLMSATLTDDVKALKKLVLHNPVTLKLNESQLPEDDRLVQYLIKCEPDDKFLLIYTLLKLRLVRGKTLLFVNGIDRCYRLKLFLEQFSIKACVLNSELPHNSRLHIVEEFNRDVYDYIIASDEASLDLAPSSHVEKKNSKKRKKDKEYGVARGIDFQGVENVINFDFPSTVEAYIHRVGRTARGDSSGTALSFVTHSDNTVISKAEERLAQETGSDKEVFKPFQFRMEEIEGFRYRARDAIRAVTKTAVKEARLKEIKREILNSEKLKAYFEDNPRDLQVLRHDKELHPAKVQAHMKNVPDYLVPAALKHNKSSRKRQNKHIPFPQKTNKKKKKDPLKTFKYNK